ncbi:hypothetical protein BBP40_003163 [Aspergillus hancockii]|nr:hypothetical protein BBP40_003163 [Aspergillus hancockii]
MASIESLLNPLPDANHFALPSPTLTSSDPVPCKSPRQKKQKIAKDAPIFNRGETRGELRYPPCEERDEELAKVHRDFQLHPMGDIADYPRHIPYNSDKKTFQERTGRESFEVFQYTFRIPGEDKQWTITWDYNIGLVRTTHLFKCQEYSKTTPAKVLNANPGLRDICHSITGGAIAAQGYWMPFETAKAVAATFCWKIRFALTPIFGLDFPSLCIHPDNRREYGRMLIDPKIVRKATETANFYRMLELRPPTLTSLRPASQHPKQSNISAAKQLSSGHHNHRDPNNPGNHGSSQEYGTPDTYCVSPTTPIHVFTPVNTPRSTRSNVPSPAEVLASLSRIPCKTSDEDSASDVTSSSTPFSESMGTPTDGLSDGLSDVDGDEEYRDSDDDNAGRRTTAQMNNYYGQMETRSQRKYRSVFFAREMKAAHALLRLHMQDVTGSDEECIWVNQGRKRRRASA